MKNPLRKRWGRTQLQAASLLHRLWSAFCLGLLLLLADGAYAALTELPVTTSASNSKNITTGPDGNLWITETSGNKIAKVTPAGQITEYAIPTADAGPYGITAGPDGNIWFTERSANRIGRLTIATGVITEFGIPTALSAPLSIVASPDGSNALWFTENGANKIGKISTDGVILAEYSVSSGPSIITVGGDGNLWFTEYNAGKIGRMNTAGWLTEFVVGGLPFGITPGPAGTDIWFTNYVNNQEVGRIALDGSGHKSYPVGFYADYIATGPDGTLWFTEPTEHKIGNMTTTGSLSETALTAGATPHGITTGPNNNVWFVETNAGNVGYINLPPATLTTLTSACSTSLASGGNGACSASATYSYGSAKTVIPAWTSSNTAALAVSSSGALTAGSVSVNTPLTITASYTEGGISKTATSTVTVKAAVVLASLTAACPSALTSGTNGNCSATATYSDGSSKLALPTWTSASSATLAVGSSGLLTAGSVSVDTPVVVSASYTDGAVTKTATATVTVQPIIVSLTGFAVSCPATLPSAATGNCTASASYSDGSSKAVTPASWVSSNSSLLSVSTAGLLTAAGVSADTPVTITASYSEGVISKTSTAMVTVLASVTKLNALTVTCPATLASGTTDSCYATAGYSDGSSKTITASWVSSNTAVLNASATGALVAGSVTANTSVTVTATYSESGVSKTAQQVIVVYASVTAAACSGSGSNLSGITIIGNALKAYGETLQVNYCLKNFNPVSKFDIYIGVQTPDGTLLFMQSLGFFGTPTFTTNVAPYLSNTLVPSQTGSVLTIPVLPMELPTGTYTFYAIPVLAGKSVMNGFNWVGSLTKGHMNLSQ